MLLLLLLLLLSRGVCGPGVGREGEGSATDAHMGRGQIPTNYDRFSWSFMVRGITLGRQYGSVFVDLLKSMI